MTTRFRLVGLAVMASLVAAPAADARHKKNWHMGDRIPLKRGMRGHDVKVLQDYLSRAGIRTGIDGIFGRGTLRSAKRFERSQRFKPNGVLHKRDLTRLRQVVESGRRVSERSAERRSAPRARAALKEDGTAVAPAEAPEVVKEIIAAGNEIAKKPYRYGGGHARWDDTGYDCSGSISYALYKAGLLKRARDSTGFMRFGAGGKGRWVTIYAHGGHAYMEVAGLRFDTSAKRENGSRWSAKRRSTSGYTVRHPVGL